MPYKLNNLILKSNITPVQTNFIEKIMPFAPPSFSLVYIYALSKCINNETVTNEEIAKKLSLLESDVVNAWKYFEEKNVVFVNKENSTIEFIDILTEEEKSESPSIPKIIPKKPEYSPDEIALYSENSKDVKELFLTAQNHLGRLLSYSDMQVLFSVYDWLGLPMEVIEILLAYCSKVGKKSMGYIEKLAISWADDNINTAEKALVRIDTYNKNNKLILKSFGLIDRVPIESEKIYIKKWLNEYKLSIDIICLACEKTVLQTGKASFQYADKILESWYKNNVKTLEDIERLEKDFQSSKTVKENIKTNQAKEKPRNKFVNYEQRNWDFDKLRELEKQFMDKELKRTNQG